jgi:mannose-6-phosphate isomerase-like protein (cupin superfamily)
MTLSMMVCQTISERIMELLKWQSVLARAATDPAVGIRIAKLAGTDAFSTYVAEVAPGKSITPHYHLVGDEHYHIVAGQGEMHLSDLDEGRDSTTPVYAGTSFVVAPRVVHALRNTGNSPLVLMFSCPVNHLGDDRHLCERV